MVIEYELARTLSTLIVGLIGKEEDFRTRKIDIQNLAGIVKESLARELRLARLLLDELQEVCPDDKESEQALLDYIETKSFDAVSSVGVPLTMILPDELDDKFWGAQNLNGLENNYIAGTNKGYLLIEKTYLRIRLFLIRRKVGVDRSNIDYIQKLITASLSILTRY